MTPLPTTLHIHYTAPASPDVGQQIAAVALDGPTVAIIAIIAVCGTELGIQHPAGQRLRLDDPALRIEQTGETLVVHLPADELDLDLDLVAEPSGTAAKIKVTTKKESSKPDPTRRATFRP